MKFKICVLTILAFFAYTTQAAKSLNYPHNNQLYASIHLNSATFGKGCGGKEGNATLFYKKICEAKVYCYYTPPPIKNIKSSCPRFLDIKWHCGVNKQIFKTSFSEEELAKGNKLILITCGIN